MEISNTNAAVDLTSRRCSSVRSTSTQDTEKCGMKARISPHKDIKMNTEKMRCFGSSPTVLTHGLQHTRHVPFGDAISHMTCGSSGFVSLHQSGRVRWYHPDGRVRDSPVHSPSTVPYAGLTSTCVAGRLLGWGPGAHLTLLDAELKPLATASDPLDIRVCQALEGTVKVVTAGQGNVCVWCVADVECVVRVVEGFVRDSVFTLLALVPAGRSRAAQALAMSGTALTVVDLDKGLVLEHKENLHPREITGLVYCPPQDAVVTASKDSTIRVWGPDWELLTVFVGHSAAVTSLLLCPVSGLLLSSSLDGTLRCWSVRLGDEVQAVSVPGTADPPLALGGPSTADTFFSFSRTGVHFWTINSLYRLHCKLGGDLSRPVRQLSVPPSDPLYPVRVLCVHGDSDVTLIAAETGVVLTAFRAGGRVRSADYCLPKEILLVLTEEGAVSRGSTLTNPVTELDEWCMMQQGDWSGGMGREEMGPACSMALYSKVTDPQRALEAWESLQHHRLQPQSKKLLDDDEKRFRVMLGHRGGCVSVVQMHSGKVQYRVSAHNGQDVTIIQTYSNNSCLLTAGADNTVLLWRVLDDVEQCLSLQTSVSCPHTPVSLALLDSVLALTLQQPDSAIYSLVQYSLHTHTRTDHPPENDHSSLITGLCISQKECVFATCSQDRTVRIWDKENCLLRILELNSELECVQFIGHNGELLLGIRGDLYHTHYTHLLPHIQLLDNEDVCYSVPELSSSYTPISCKPRDDSSPISKEKEEEIKDQVLELVQQQDRDLHSLLSGETQSHKEKLIITQENRTETFNQYIQILYGQPLQSHIPEEDTLDLPTALPLTRPLALRPLTPPTLRAAILPHCSLAQKQDKLRWGRPPRGPLCFVPNSVLAGLLWPNEVMEKHTRALQKHLNQETEKSEQAFIHEEEEGPPILTTDTLPKQLCPLPPIPPNLILPPAPPPVQLPKPRTSIKRALPVRPPPLSPPLPPPPTPPPSLPKPSTPTPPKLATPQPQTPIRPATPIPPTPPRAATPPPQTPIRLATPTPQTPPTAATPPSPLLPSFMQQFVQEQWFHNMYPDQRCIPQSLSPAEFCGQLLDYLNLCSVDEKLCVLRAITTLHTHHLLSNTHSLTQGLLTTLDICLHKNMSNEEQCFVGELLAFVVCVDPNSSDITVELLSLLANKELKLQSMVVCVLQALGVDDLQDCLAAQLELWDSAARRQQNHHHALRASSCRWLHSWSSRYRKQKRLGSSSVVSPVEVLRYFCWVQKKVQMPPPEGRKDTVLLDSDSHRFKAVQRLGETYSMYRIRGPQRLHLPSLVSRPPLTGFPLFVSLPLPRVTLSLFPFALDPQNLTEPLPRRYFLLEQSYVHYYR